MNRAVPYHGSAGRRAWRGRGSAAAQWAAALSILLAAGVAHGQPPTVSPPADHAAVDSNPAARRFTSAADSLNWERARALAVSARGLRLVISLLDRRLWAIVNDDTLLTATIAVASGSSLDYQGKRWSFTTPRGRRTVVRKDSLPLWIPPDWHYYEVARANGFVVRPLLAGQSVALDDGRRLEINSGLVGLRGPDSTFVPLPPGDEIVFDGFLYLPPLETENRRIAGELGRHRLDLGGGYSLHGTPHTGSIGQAVTHGCIRMRDEDIAWLYEVIPLGARVYIY